MQHQIEPMLERPLQIRRGKGVVSHGGDAALSCNGSNRGRALQRAENIEYTVVSQDSVLNLGSGFSLGRGDKFRAQKVLVEVSVPVGKQIRFDQSVSDKLDPYDIRIAENDRSNRRRNWNRRNWDFEWDNSWYYDWQPETDYYMTADGRLQEVGTLDIETPTAPETNRDTLLRTRDTRSIRNKEEEVVVEEPETVTQRKETGGELPAPLPMPFVTTIF